MTEMERLGLAATEFGPDGFLPDDPEAEGGLPRDVRPAGRRRLPPGRCCTTRRTTRMAEVDAFIDSCLATGAGVVVLAASTGTRRL